MPNYRRIYKPGTTWFFTVNLAQRKNNPLLIQHIDFLSEAFRYVQRRRPFTLNAIVVLPDHLHCLWTLPPGDSDYSTRWQLLKSHFSRRIAPTEPRSSLRQARGERGIWQRRFWAHVITSQQDFNQHVDYIHWNPVKHGHTAQASEWPYSSLGRFIAKGILPPDWGHDGRFDIDVRE